ncbi:MAG: hypothetical protein FT714_20340, partial [Pantoea sp. Pent]|nr:hypothetical protein [Pantoea sp. Pent]
WWYSTTVGMIDLKKKSITMGKGCEKVFTMSPNTCLPCPRTVHKRARGPIQRCVSRFPLKTVFGRLPLTRAGEGWGRGEMPPAPAISRVSPAVSESHADTRLWLHPCYRGATP